MGIHKTHPMNAERLECILLVKFLWIILNWSILKLTEEVSGVEMSFHKLTRTALARSNALNLDMLQNMDKLQKWLGKMIKISIINHKKEYKKCNNELPINVLRH